MYMVLVSYHEVEKTPEFLVYEVLFLISQLIIIYKDISYNH